MIAETALAELRVNTRAEHDRIEALLRLMEPMALPRYAAVMTGFDAFLAAWEPRVEAALSPRLRPWFAARRRGALASADVRWLAEQAGQAPAAMHADAVCRLQLEDVAAVMGSLYVIEGSALGGRVIAPRLAQTLGVGPGRGADYFEGFGAATGAMWRDFRLTASQAIGESPQAVALACASARSTFAAMAEVFAGLAAS